MADSGININLSKWYHGVIAIMPLIALLGSGWFWLDTRYMHKEISDTRFIELQIRIVQSNVRDYNRRIDAGEDLNAQETLEYDMEKDQLKFLMNERNKVLDIGGLPE